MSNTKTTAETHYGDADRVRLATQRGEMMFGPSERGRCQHGCLYSYRWKRPADASPEDGDCEIVSYRCARCSS